jgi:hypothetical protein
MTLRRHTTIGPDAVALMLMACHGAVWETKNPGKFTIIRRDGSESVVDGFGLGNETHIVKEQEDAESISDA